MTPKSIRIASQVVGRIGRVGGLGDYS